MAPRAWTTRLEVSPPVATRAPGLTPVAANAPASALARVPTTVGPGAAGSRFAVPMLARTSPPARSTAATCSAGDRTPSGSPAISGATGKRTSRTPFARRAMLWAAAIVVGDPTMTRTPPDIGPGAGPGNPDCGSSLASARPSPPQPIHNSSSSSGTAARTSRARSSSVTASTSASAVAPARLRSTPVSWHPRTVARSTCTGRSPASSVRRSRIRRLPAHCTPSRVIRPVAGKAGAHTASRRPVALSIAVISPYRCPRSIESTFFR
ncbi:MAG TPA: hypothetical protein VKV33_07760 [Streptosporangiaceae bacterium]|nr:hypothetical protein [Streptosporangiaceae bacterium]